jgi:hypothetical protein
VRENARITDMHGTAKWGAKGGRFVRFRAGF